MSSGFGIEIPRIENAELFEDLCFDLLERAFCKIAPL